MIRLTEAAGRVISSDATTAFRDTDQALLSGVRLAASVLEGTVDSGLPPRTKQKLLESVSSSFDKMLAGRRDMVQAHTQMIVIQGQSSIAEVDFGCLGAPIAHRTSAEGSIGVEQESQAA
jgi:tellurite resistance protein